MSGTGGNECLAGLLLSDLGHSQSHGLPLSQLTHLTVTRTSAVTANSPDSLPGSH